MKKFIKIICVISALIIALSMFTGCNVIEYIFGKGSIPSSTDTKDDGEDETTKAEEILYTDYDVSAITKLGEYKTGELNEDLTVSELDILNEYYYYIEEIYDIDETTEIVEDGNVTQNDVDCKNLLKSLYVKTGTVKEYDMLSINYVGTLDGEQFEGGTGSDKIAIVGNKKYITGFEESMVGKNIGESYDVEVTFPENYSETLGGKKVNFNITINYKFPELSTDSLNLLKQYNATEYTTVDAFKDAVTSDLKKQKKETFESNLISDILYTIYKNSEFGTLPEAEVNELKALLQENADYYNVDLLTYMYYMYGITSEDAITEYINYQISLKLIIAKIILEEKMELTDEEYKEACQKYCETYSYESIEALEEAATVNVLKNMIYVDKVSAFLKDSWTVKVVE